MLQTPLESEKEILGYRLLERIGSGGFGEVWSAVAPGGLKKALKVVYGFHDGRRAQAELKSLDRVKELRHPFLLSLERIEIHDDQLIVVSELADQCLADRFNECVIGGSPGVPREELIRYIQNAAEALDYLSTEHNLQHLDVKPENLLIVGSHIKVADFGLIKDLRNASQSLMSGMTPAYASPEMFDGRPVSSSDQYSLAIVYQEMLTGVRPFAGSTPAQLAAQHMNGKPNLASLPKSDQPTIAKALSKDPELRFASCRQMVEELTHVRRAPRKTIRRQREVRDQLRTESATVNMRDGNVHDVTARISDRAMLFRAAEISIETPPDCNQQDARLRPTLIIGVGATGARIIQKLKGRLAQQYGPETPLSAIQLLAIDTDRQLLASLRREPDAGPLTAGETLETPLRKPEDYRGHCKSKSLLNWLSRRWIYNVPRSLQTEGLRPLGRLAFADHFEDICDRIQQAIQEMSLPEAIAQTADALNLDPQVEKPRVMFVSSVSGGVGSGMLLDLAYTTRLLLLESGIQATEQTGILLHSSYQRFRDPGLAAANAFAFLTEFRHVTERGYPGDSNIGIPEFEDELPFDATYFNDLGNDLKQSDFDKRLDDISEYLLLSTTSRCSVFLDECRQLEHQQEEFSLRTFGLSKTGPANSDSAKGTVSRIALGLTKRWLHGPTGTETSAEQLASQLMVEAELEASAAKNRLDSLLQTKLPWTDQEIVQQACDQILANTIHARSTLDDFGDDVFGVPATRRDSSFVEPEHCQAIENEFGSCGQRLAETLVEKLMQRAADSAGFWGIEQTTETIRSQIRSIGERLDSLTEYQATEASLLTELEQLQLGRDGEAVRERLNSIVSAYCRVRKDEMADRYLKDFYQVVLNSLDALSESLTRYRERIESISSQFLPGDDMAHLFEEDERLDMDTLLNDHVERGLNAMITTTEKRFLQPHCESGGGFVRLLDLPELQDDQLVEEIRATAQQVVGETYRKISLEEVIVQNNIEPERLVKWLNEMMVEATPGINDCGGVSRILIGLPELSDDQCLAQLLERQFSIRGCPIRGTQGNLVVCFETESLGFAEVAFRLLRCRPDAIELVKRIHSRNDVDWTTLDDLL